jgi:hypothetical protein
VYPFFRDVVPTQHLELEYLRHYCACGAAVMVKYLPRRTHIPLCQVRFSGVCCAHHADDHLQLKLSRVAVICLKEKNQ